MISCNGTRVLPAGNGSWVLPATTTEGFSRITSVSFSRSVVSTVFTETLRATLKGHPRTWHLTVFYTWD